MTTSSPLFPVTMPEKWQLPEQFSLSAKLLDWLSDSGSLTSRLKSLSDQFEVVVLGQQIQPCSEHEATEDIKADEQILVREVLLKCDDKPVVFARSLIPMSSLTGDQKALANVGNQSLGQLLFNDPALERTAFTVAEFSQSGPIISLCEHLGLQVSYPLYGRRSIFKLAGKPLSVAEIFLPDSFPYQQES
ncbi:chorismate--pyruvate lyase family protein [Thalassotalea agarivorans]|uniref:Probable chorismate pyruvate-lyase n=1 Tax=Thalassotalea agarivorans TaxID=349064 RepID=A0A1I0CN65_THASX|nr:chorismate lyase [Thalassotalea agarivorans]SET21091.1 chorismate lyase [Thalassotalea agarivorans]